MLGKDVALCISLRGENPLTVGAQPLIIWGLFVHPGVSGLQTLGGDHFIWWVPPQQQVSVPQLLV